MNQGFSCPCCGYLTLSERPPGTYEICSVCGWEDDLVQFENPDIIGGSNSVSLNQAKINYKKMGAIEQSLLSSVRPPKAEEVPLHK
ncbi:MAG TPA: CPCC family cysteine-rich protein [Pseudobdellovibrionaceae bacterium]|nr:CPCC family cysteine-rich protein [Pseudobdellovibrionaceae bacterium]